MLVHRMRGLFTAALASLILLTACGKSETFVVKSALKNAREIETLDLGRQLRDLMSGSTGGSPRMMRIKLYAAYITNDQDCRDADANNNPKYTEVANHGTTGSEIDPVAGATLFSASPGAGDYKCMILEMSDVISFQPDQAAETKHGESICDYRESNPETYRFDILRQGETTWKTKEGQTITGAGTVGTPAESSATVSGTERKGVTIFFSTVGNGSIAAGPSGHQVVSLTSGGFTVPTSGATTLTVQFDFANKVTTNTDSTTGVTRCWMDPGPTTITASR